MASAHTNRYTYTQIYIHIDRHTGVYQTTLWISN